MSLRTRALAHRMPEAVRRRVIRGLFRATVDAFDAPMPDLRGRSAESILATYVASTDVLARGVLSEPERRSLVERRLFENTRRLGRRVRRALGVRTTADAFAVAHLLYEVIGIDLTANGEGGVVVSRCVFAARYSPEVCRLMSASDAGLFAGLTGGGRLTFTERITSGSPMCVAMLAANGGAR